MGKLARYEKDEMGAHGRLYESIANAPAWLALSFSARALYMQLRVKLKGSNNGNIDATLTTLRHAGFKSPSTLAKALRELETVGLMAKTRQGGITAGGRLCNLYRFTDKPAYEFPKLGLPACGATKDWLAWTGVREASAAITAAHLAAKRPTGKNTPKLQKSKRINTEIGAEGLDLSSKSGARRAASVQISKRRFAA